MSQFQRLSDHRSPHLQVCLRSLQTERDEHLFVKRGTTRKTFLERSFRLSDKFSFPLTWIRFASRKLEMLDCLLELDDVDVRVWVFLEIWRLLRQGFGF